jgi:lipopolysaccharide transport system ATP-binding protein
MSDTVIAVEKLTKRYLIGQAEQRRETLIGSLAAALTAPIRNARKIARLNVNHVAADATDILWALSGVSFDVKRGEVVGIVGRNGAGKSTLLKILSRITEPTSGWVGIKGRIASLLEVGTGFHPELTGRENVYLNGTLLGMTKREVDRKFDEIVNFSGIERFLDTPVKRYSSGMSVRLAFAVAAHLEPEILIVDEVLAVGDFAFQKKCLGKMQEVAAGDGRTILFVSHNMGAMAQLCQRAVLLEKGMVTAIGPIRDVISTYLQSGSDHKTARAQFPFEPSKPCQFLSAEVLHVDGTPGSQIGCDEPFIVRLRFEVREALPSLRIWFTLLNAEGIRVFCSYGGDDDPSTTDRLGIGLHTFNITVPGQLLAPMTYLMNIGCSNQRGEQFDFQMSCCEFTLHHVGAQQPGRPGFFSTVLPWEHQQDVSVKAGVAFQPGEIIMSDRVSRGN